MDKPKTTKYKLWTHPTAPPIPLAITCDELPEQRIVAVLKNNASATTDKWLPISAYDALKKKPARVVFAMAANEGRHALSAGVVLSRVYGYREITHWMPLPELPYDN